MATIDSPPQIVGNIPENLKELLANAAKEYQWSPKKLENVEKGLEEQQWTPEQVAEIEKAIKDEQWTIKDIADIEKAYQQQKKLTRDSFANNSNPKLHKFANACWSIQIDIHINCI